MFIKMSRSYGFLTRDDTTSLFELDRRVLQWEADRVALLTVA
jgi:hypothetical protein